MYENFQLISEAHSNMAGYHWKNKDAKCVVCIVHGIGEYAGRYDRVAEHMKNAGFAVLSMDLPGHGISPGRRGHCAPRAEVREYVDLLLRYAAETYPHAAILLYGHSMGGNIVLDYRKQGKENSLPAGYIVTAPWIQLAKPVTGALYTAVKLLSKIAPSFGISSGVSSRDLGHADSVGDYDKDPLVHGKISALCAVEGFDIGARLEMGKLADNGGAKGTPLLLMHGMEDKVCSIEGSRKVAAGEACDYVEWPGLYHEIHNGGPDSTGEEVIERMIEWIQAL